MQNSKTHSERLTSAEYACETLASRRIPGSEVEGHVNPA
jgi:hypothetical protein